MNLFDDPSSVPLDGHLIGTFPAADLTSTATPVHELETETPPDALISFNPLPRDSESPLLTASGPIRSPAPSRFQLECDPTVQEEHIGLAHAAFRNLFQGFNHFAVFLSETIFTGNSIGRTACVACTALGWLVPAELYSEHPVAALIVAGGALSGAIAASAVNRAIHYNPLLIGDDGIAEHIRHQGQSRFRESLLVAGMVAGPASFWASISPVLRILREAAVNHINALSETPSYIAQLVDYTAGRVEHLVPFLLIGALTTMKLVNNDPERFVRSMSPTAGMLSPLFNWWPSFHERISKELSEPSEEK